MYFQKKLFRTWPSLLLLRLWWPPPPSLTGTLAARSPPGSAGSCFPTLSLSLIFAGESDVCALVTTTLIAESSSMPSVDVEEEELTTDVTHRSGDERPAGLGAKQEHCC